MVEAVMLWNEPNNLSHWDFHLDPDWKIFAETTIAAAQAVRAVNPETRIVNEGTVQHEGKTLAIRLYHDGARYFIGFHPTSGSFEHLNFSDEEKLVKVAELQFGPITWK